MGSSADQAALENQYRRYSWESGHIDYLGRDSFSNIWSKIQETIDEVPIPLIQEPVAVPSVSHVQEAPAPAVQVVAAATSEASPEVVVKKVEEKVQKKPAASKEVKKPKSAKKEGGK